MGVRVLRDAAGVTIIATTTLAVAGWLYSQRPAPGKDTFSMSTAEALESAGLSDASELMEFVEIPGGSFSMGSDPELDPMAYDNERWSSSNAQGTVELPRFHIGRYEVTRAQFSAFAAATGFQAHPDALVGPPEAPVGSVSWPDALAYCRWLERELLEWPHTPATVLGALDDGFRITLPTEAQWEKAARGGDGRIFPWGNEPRPDLANYEGRSTTLVGGIRCAECSYGLSDMSGNVWELTRSPYRPYPFESAIDDVDLDTDALWVMRGGSYADPAQNVRAAIRGGAEPGARRPFIGFRVALTRPER